MRFHYILTLLVLTSLYSCNNSDKKESIKVETTADTVTKKIEFQYLKTDYPERVFAFKKMSDGTPEEQVVKYETFSILFIEYVGINEKQPMYSLQDQKNNREAFDVLRDEVISLKQKIKKNMMLFSKNQEDRLDAADANMNEFLPQVYK